VPSTFARLCGDDPRHPIPLNGSSNSRPVEAPHFHHLRELLDIKKNMFWKEKQKNNHAFVNYKSRVLGKDVGKYTGRCIYDGSNGSPLYKNPPINK
jgi:hypothetical protein